MQRVPLKWCKIKVEQAEYLYPMLGPKVDFSALFKDFFKGQLNGSLA